jgi:hypothetical protein
VAERKKLLLRLSPSLWEELSRWAAQEFRSVNGQIEFLLQRAVDARRGGSEAAPTRTDAPDLEAENRANEGEDSG